MNFQALKRVLSTATAPASAKPATVTKWVRAAALAKQELDEFPGPTEQHLEPLSKEKRPLKDRAGEFGLAFSSVASMKNQELFKRIAAAFAMSLASWFPGFFVNFSPFF